MREQKNDFAGMDCLVEISARTDLFSRISWDAQVCQRGDSANMRLQAELTKDSRKTRQPPSAPLDIATVLWLHMRTKLTKPQPFSDVLKEASWGIAHEWMPAEKLAAQQSPWRLYSEVGIFLPHLSFLQDRQQQLWKTANTSLSSALIFFTFPLPTQFLLSVYK